MILVYSHKLTHRLKYIFNVILKDVLKTELKFTSNIEEFEASELPKINYSNHKLNSGLFFQSSQLLFETGIKNKIFRLVLIKNTLVFLMLVKILCFHLMFLQLVFI